MPSVDTLTPISQAVLPSSGAAPGPVPRVVGVLVDRQGSGHASRRLPLVVVDLCEAVWDGCERSRADRSAFPAVELVLEGTLRWIQDGRAVEAAAGHVLVLKPGAQQQYDLHDGPARTLRIGLGGQLAADLVAGLPDRIVPGDPGESRRLFDELRELFRDLPPDHQVRASAVAYRLLLQLSLAPQSTTASVPLTPTVAAALRILETSGARDLDVRQVARTVGTSVSHLHRLFKEALGTSPLRYARERLIAQARDALSTTTLSCQEIAKRLGYDDPLYFSAVFKRLTGVSPREYRKRSR